MNNITPVVRNLIIANVALFALTWIGERAGFDLTQYFALYYPASEHFHLFQYITYMFMHGGLMHIFFNMYALWIFGSSLEQVWGGKRFLLFYMVTGVGAAVCHTCVNWVEAVRLQSAADALFSNFSPDTFGQFMMAHFGDRINIDALDRFIDAWGAAPNSSELINTARGFVHHFITASYNIPTVGASGAVFGVLLAFGMLFPSAELMLLFPPIPIKAKWLVIGYGAIELGLGIFNTTDGVAHFAHLGGMLFGFILIKYWQKRSQHFY